MNRFKLRTITECDGYVLLMAKVPKPPGFPGLQNGLAGAQIEERRFMFNGWVLFFSFVPFVSLPSKARTQRPDRAEIARKKRKRILAISAGQGTKRSKTQLE